MTSFKQLPVLIVGAGPTGLVLALWLQRLGTPFRIIDRNPFAADTSRAMVVHARTLEIYRILGIVEKVVESGIPVDHQVMWENSQVTQKVNFRHTGEGQSKYPFVLIYPQNRHEELLNKELAQNGINVEREVELVALTQTHDYATATLTKKDGKEEQVDASFVVGCDGGSSRTRQFSSIEMSGGAYERRFYVADVRIDSSKSPHMSHADMNMCFSGHDFTMVFPLPHDQAVRLIGICPDEVDPEHITFESIQPSIKRNAGVEVTDVNWFSTYKVQHRVASSFRDRRVFLCGDAAHVHSPVGGQGLNYSVQDATNLAWKLHSVVSNQSPTEILDTYCSEREAHAHNLVGTTDRIFSLITDRTWVGTLFRRIVMGYVVPSLMRIPLIARYAFPRLSQIGISYPTSKLSINGSPAGFIVAGSRLPWIENLAKGGKDNFESLKGRWQIQIYGEADEAIKNWSRAKGIELVEVELELQDARAKGLLPDTVCLLRPDGYIGYVSSLNVGYMGDLDNYASTWLKA